jgi:hypothetical protein
MALNLHDTVCAKRTPRHHAPRMRHPPKVNPEARIARCSWFAVRPRNALRLVDLYAEEMQKVDVRTPWNI